LILIASLGCTGPKKLRLNEVVHSIFYTPQYVALHKNFFQAEGLEIELSTAWGGDKAASALMSNNADIALIGPEPSIYIYQRGADNHPVNFAQLTQKAGSFLVARKPMPNFQIQNVAGKKIIGNRPGGAPQMVLEHALKKHGIKPTSDVDIVTKLDFNSNAPAFKNGLGDFVQLFEPKASQLEKSGAGQVVASLGELGGKVPYTVYMTRKSYLDRNPKTIKAFTRAIYRAQKWTYNHSATEIARVIRPSFPELDFSVLVKVIKRYKTQNTWSPTPVLEKESFNRWQTIIQEAGELEEKVPYNQVVNTEFAEEVLKQK